VLGVVQHRSAGAAVDALSSDSREGLDVVSFSAHIMRMNRTQARQAGPLYVERLWPVLAAIYDLMESGCAEAYLYIESTGAQAINAHLFSMLVRDHVCRGLDALKRTGSVDFLRAYKSMCGIEVFYEGLKLKVLRPGIDEDGDATLPAAKSGQQSLFYMGNFIPYDASQVFISNLVMLWDSDHATRTLSAWLACPDEGRESLFCEAIPHPATGLSAPPAPEPTPTDDLDDTYQRADEDEEDDRAADEGEGEDE
jgi:hypothetical protein